ncbi:hypothetical protein FACS1894152_0070 [Bacilli bacterium]|nr:hypothetical protein FACS1894152_0070 [Bacilli bacterium]
MAKINGIKIYKKDLEFFLPMFTEKIENENAKIEDLDSKTLESISMEVYLNKMVYKLALEDGVRADDDIKLFVREYYEKLIKDKFINKKIIDNIKEKDLEERYQKLTDMVKNREERKISHIVVKTEEEADRIRNMILRFNNFESMASQKSLDRESSVNGGSIGYVIKEKISIPEFAEIAFLLKIGELSRPIETKNGWHIVRVDDIRNMKTKSYEESREEVLEQVKQEKFDEFIDGMMHRPKIKLFSNFDKNKNAKDGDGDTPQNNNEGNENTNDNTNGY